MSKKAIFEKLTLFTFLFLSNLVFTSCEKQSFKNEDVLVVSPKEKSKVSVIIDSADAVPVPVYQYYNNDGSDHFYVSPYQGSYIGGGWHFEIVPFKAFSSMNTATGCIPIYRYYNAVGCDHYYTNTYQGASIGPWQYESIAFYAFDRQKQGTVPVYSYYSGNFTDHYYTTYYSGPTAGDGNWHYERIEFYTIP